MGIKTTWRLACALVESAIATESAALQVGPPEFAGQPPAWVAEAPDPEPVVCGTVRLFPYTFSVPRELVAPCVPEKTQDFALQFPGEVATYVFDPGGEADFAVQEYFQMLRTALFAVTRVKSGFDAPRHTEILASGTVPFFVDLEAVGRHALAHHRKACSVPLRVHTPSCASTYVGEDHRRSGPRPVVCLSGSVSFSSVPQPRQKQTHDTQQANTQRQKDTNAHRHKDTKTQQQQQRQKQTHNTQQTNTQRQKDTNAHRHKDTKTRRHNNNNNNNDKNQHHILKRFLEPFHFFFCWGDF